MPLPDETPRQSVANLIGRFEQQVKRTPPPSSFSANGESGDGTKEEGKEKKEWLPRYSREIPRPPIIPSSSWSRAQATTEKTQPPPLETSTASAQPQVELNVQEPTPSTATFPNIPIPEPVPAPEQEPTPEPEAKPEPKLEPKPEPAPSPQRQPSAEKDVTTKPAPSRTSNSSIRNSANRTSTSSVNSKVTPKESSGSIKSTRSSISTSPSAPSLKPQLTGQSTTSTRSSKTGPKPSAATPSRAKTPSTLAPRPKTPSTGLYAPTAASLARSRNAPELPTPTKKVTLSNAAAERLSKPTAASLSKARSPVLPAATPANRGPQRSNSGKTPSNGILKGKPAVKGEKQAAALTPEASSVEGGDFAGYGYDVAAAVLSDDLPSLSLSLGVEGGGATARTNGSTSRNGGAFTNTRSRNASREPTPQPGSMLTGKQGNSMSEKQDDRLDEVKSRIGDDLEDIVNVLEGNTLSKELAERSYSPVPSKAWCC